MVNRYVMKSEHDLFIDYLPYEWRSGTSDGLFLPIYPCRSMCVMLGFWWLVDFCNKYMSSLWLMLSPWIIRTLTLPSLVASSVPCIALSHLESWCKLRRCIQPRDTIRSITHKPLYIFLKTATIPTYYGISIAIPRYIAMQLSTVPFMMTRSSLSYCFEWSCSWHSICGKATIHNSFIHVTLGSLHIPVHCRRHSYRVIFCSSIEL